MTFLIDKEHEMVRKYKFFVNKLFAYQYKKEIDNIIKNEIDVIEDRIEQYKNRQYLFSGQYEYFKNGRDLIDKKNLLIDEFVDLYLKNKEKRKEQIKRPSQKNNHENFCSISLGKYDFSHDYISFCLKTEKHHELMFMLENKTGLFYYGPYIFSHRKAHQFIDFLQKEKIISSEDFFHNDDIKRMLHRDEKESLDPLNLKTNLLEKYYQGSWDELFLKSKNKILYSNDNIKKYFYRKVSSIYRFDAFLDIYHSQLINSEKINHLDNQLIHYLLKDKWPDNQIYLAHKLLNRYYFEKNTENFNHAIEKNLVVLHENVAKIHRYNRYTNEFYFLKVNLEQKITEPQLINKKFNYFLDWKIQNIQYNQQAKDKKKLEIEKNADWSIIVNHSDCKKIVQDKLIEVFMNNITRQKKSIEKSIDNVLELADHLEFNISKSDFLLTLIHDEEVQELLEVDDLWREKIKIEESFIMNKIGSIKKENKKIGNIKL